MPEDRADVLYHYYDGGGVQVDGPSVLVRKQVAQAFSLSASYYVDTVSSASIDVLTTASPYGEERIQAGVGVDYLRGDTLLSVGFSNSDENDYTADTLNVGISQEVFGGLTTVSLGYGRGSDEVRRNTPTQIPRPGVGGQVHRIRTVYRLVLEASTHSIHEVVEVDATRSPARLANHDALEGGFFHEQPGAVASRSDLYGHTLLAGDEPPILRRLDDRVPRD